MSLEFGREQSRLETEVRGSPAELTWDDTWDVPVDRGDSGGHAIGIGEKRGTMESVKEQLTRQEENMKGGHAGSQRVLEEGMHDDV